MPKPWAKYEVDFINHDKFRAISANAICLWLEGKNYADDKHTDGLLPVYEAKHWRFYGTKALAMLTTSAGRKPGTEQDYAPLWEVVEIGGVPYYRMHDYLDHNDCREAILARIEQADESRKADRERLRKWREAKRAKRRETTSETAPETAPETAAETPVTLPKRSRQNTDPDPEENKERSLSEQRAHLQAAHRALGGEKRLDGGLPPKPTDALAGRAGNLVDRYGELFQQHRFGARYHSRPALDFDDALKLVAEWDDDARLEKLAVLVLTTDEPWIAGTDRSFKIFALKASWADQRLAEWEAKRRPA